MAKISQIEHWELSRIQPYKNNAKLHPESHIEQIAASIGEFEFLDPVAVDEKGELLEGHGRLLAAKARGMTAIPVIQITGLSDAQKTAYRLAHNKLTVNTGFDVEALKIDFEILRDLDFDLNLTGFDAEGLDFIENLNSDGESFEKSENPDDREQSLELVFPSSNEYGIPDLLLSKQATSVFLPFIKWGTRARKDGGNDGTVHFYTEDYKFNAIWSDPDAIKKSGAVCAVEPNFSTNDQMPKVCVLWNIFKKRWLARYWQQQGLRIIVDLAIAPAYRDLALLGVPSNWSAYATHFYAVHDDEEWIENDYAMACDHAETKDIIFVVYGGNKKQGEAWRKRGWLWFPLHHQEKLATNEG